MKVSDLSRILTEVALVLLITLSPSLAYCGTLTGTISSILYWQPTPNIVFINIDGTVSAAPTCATATNRMTLDISIPAGKAMFTNLLALKLTNPTAIVILNGSNTCTAYGNTEDLMYIFL